MIAVIAMVVFAVALVLFVVFSIDAYIDWSDDPQERTLVQILAEKRDYYKKLSRRIV